MAIAPMPKSFRSRGVFQLEDTPVAITKTPAALSTLAVSAVP
jgi:hypothetical protein